MQSVEDVDEDLEQAVQGSHRLSQVLKIHFLVDGHVVYIGRVWIIDHDHCVLFDVLAVDLREFYLEKNLNVLVDYSIFRPIRFQGEAIF